MTKEKNTIKAIQILDHKDKAGHEFYQTVKFEKNSEGYTVSYGTDDCSIVKKLTNETITALTDKFNKGEKMDKETIEKLSLKLYPCNCLVKLYNAAFKDKARKEREERFNSENCTVSYEGETLVFNPKYTLTKNERTIILFKTLNKNSIYYVYSDENGTCSFSSVPCCSEKNKNYNHYERLTSHSEGYCNNLMNTIIKGLPFDRFMEICKAFKGFKLVSCPTGLKNK